MALRGKKECPLCGARDPIIVGRTVTFECGSVFVDYYGFYALSVQSGVCKRAELQGVNCIGEGHK